MGEEIFKKVGNNYYRVREISAIEELSTPERCLIRFNDGNHTILNLSSVETAKLLGIDA